MKLPELLYSTLSNTCPRCHKGKIFQNSNPYVFNAMFKMHKNCPNCQVSFQREPGFYYGAMYVSYALMAGWFIVWFVVNTFWLKFDALVLALSITSGILVLSPLIFRWARIIWLNFFVRYTPSVTKGPTQIVSKK